MSSIKTYINFYYDDDVDNNVCNIRVDGELISLTTLFVDADKPIVYTNKEMLLTRIKKVI